MDIDFAQPKLGGDILPLDNGTPTEFIYPRSIQPPSFDEKKAFLTGLRTLLPKSAILATCFPQQPRNAPPIRRLPRTITSFYHPKYKKLSPASLSKCCEQVFTSEIKITEEESCYLAKCTRLQSQSATWFEHRRGRLTASKFKAVCRTSITNPSQSLIAQILQWSSFPKSAAFRGE